MTELEAMNRDKAQMIVIDTERVLGERFNTLARHELAERISAALNEGADASGRKALAAELLGHLDRITSTTAAYHFVKNLCKIELGLEPDSLGAEIDH